MSHRVIVFGSLNMDQVASVARIAAPGETVAALGFASFPGGKGGNQALAAQLAGGEVVLLGKLGDDALGRQLLAFYEEKGLATDHIGLSKDQPTGTALIQVERAGGQNSIVVAAGANGDFRARDMARVAIAPGDLVVAQFEVPLDCVAALFRRARAAGATTLLNPSPIASVPDGLLGNVDILVVNESELAALAGAGRDVAEAATALAAEGARTVVVTLGADGVLACGGEAPLRLPGRRVAAVDTTGAGDCFAGTLAAALSRGRDLAAALAFANTAAALSVQKEGAGPSMPTANEIEAALVE